MGIREGQLFEKEGAIWYRSNEFGELGEIDIPSADSVTLRTAVAWGKGAIDMGDRKRVKCLLNLEAIKEDAAAYCDQRFIQDLEYGGNANLELPFESLILQENYKMEKVGAEKLKEKLSKEVGKDFITDLLELESLLNEYPRLRIHPMGLIPKSRRDRLLKRLGQIGDITWRTISDMKKILSDGRSINEASGEFGKIELPQGDRLKRVIRKVIENCIERGLDPTEIKITKWDVKSAYRNFRVAIADRWALGFVFEGKYGTHKSWPFGNIASVYNFLRFPLFVVWYLMNTKEFAMSTAENAMYFDDLMIIAHESDMVQANEKVKRKFEEWGVPRQEEKFQEENPNGMKGASCATLLGHEYDLRNQTIGIPRNRIREIVVEIRSFVENDRSYFRKTWESTIGTLSWVRVVIPQIGPLLQSGYALLRMWNSGLKRKCGERIKGDWKEMIQYLKKWNGRMAILVEHVAGNEKDGVIGIEPELCIDPSADASGSIGWGAVCEFGYAKGEWTDEEREIPIHIKEGLALWMLIRLFGEEMKGKHVTVKWVSLRSDNQPLIAALKRGRGGTDEFNVVIRLMFETLIEQGVSLSTWNVKALTQVGISFIGTKQNVMADALSRNDLSSFRNYIDRNRLTVFPKLRKRRIPGKEDMRIWNEKVAEILQIMRTRKQR